MNQTPRKSLSCLNFGLIVLVLTGLFCILDASTLQQRYVEPHRIQLLNRHLPSQFPLIVFARNEDTNLVEPQLVFYDELNQYIKAHPDYSYVVPRNQWSNYSQQVNDIERIPHDPDSERTLYVHFSVYQGTTGRQRFDVNYSPDSDMDFADNGVYEANTHSFVLEDYADGHQVVYEYKWLVYIALANCILAMLMTGLYSKLMKLRTPSGS